MKTAERHQLKSNEVVATVVRLRAAVAGRERTLTWAVAGVLLLTVLAGALWARRDRQQAQAQALLAEAMSVATAQVVPPPAPPAPGAVSPPAPPAGSFPSEQARAEAAVQKFLAVANRYGSTQAGLSARYQAAGLLAGLGRVADAEREFRAAADAAGTGVYGRMAKLGLAEMQLRAGQWDPAIATFRELAARGDGDLPVDGVLMQLGRAYALAGKRAEALQTFTRVADEFPQSLYAADARREADALKAAGTGGRSAS